MSSSSFGYRLAHFPLVKIIVGLLAIFLATAIVQSILDLILTALNVSNQWALLIMNIAIGAASVAAYYFLFKYYEKRNISELSTQKLGKNLGFGILLGFGLMAITILTMYVLGCYKIVSINTSIVVIPMLAMAIVSGISEEILIRGVLFRIIEEKLGSYIAIAITALIFGLLHIWNPNSSIYASLSIAIEAGILLAAAYVFTRNLWFPIAIHFMWNFSQGWIFGANVSGTDATGALVNAEFSGSALVTGGSFGPEASIPAIVICSVVSVYLIVMSHKRNNIIKPFWVSNSQK